jgi:hypothetical protein
VKVRRDHTKPLRVLAANCIQRLIADAPPAGKPHSPKQ